MNNLGQFSSGSPLHNLAKKKRKKKSKETARGSTDKKESSPNKMHILYRKEIEANQEGFVKIPKMGRDWIRGVSSPVCWEKDRVLYTLFQFFGIHAGLRGQSRVGTTQAAKSFLGIEVGFLAPSRSRAKCTEWLAQENSLLPDPSHDLRGES